MKTFKSYSAQNKKPDFSEMYIYLWHSKAYKILKLLLENDNLSLKRGAIK